MITLKDFQSIDLRVATILSVQEHPDADRLYVMKINLGEEERTIVAGIRSHYNKEDLEGRQIVVVANLEPATLRGVESEGMLLAARDENNEVILLSPSEKITEGSRLG
ncbi:methionine--tRNA ligase subunit beta [PVC group bacterium (ex Bugula neritina AB1)]|nr:methionine--tRNA ligase subunit beta [PVC group bacterium (ex Bugula neritina AB1)]